MLSDFFIYWCFVFLMIDIYGQVERVFYHQVKVRCPCLFQSKILQGLLCVSYNLGDGDYNLTLPTYRLDNGEWHEVFLDRHDNEMVLKLDGGGGQREVMGSQGRSREIIIDPTVVMLGNTFPSGVNKSFQGMTQEITEKTKQKKACKLVI